MGRGALLSVQYFVAFFQSGVIILKLKQNPGSVYADFWKSLLQFCQNI